HSPILLTLFLSCLTSTPTSHTYTLSLTTLFRSFSLYRPRSRNKYIVKSKFRFIPNFVGFTNNPFAKSFTEYRNSLSQKYFVTCRSEEHTSELQSRENLVCRLLLEKKKNIIIIKS